MSNVPASPLARYIEAEKLLLEALEHITDKPWDDPSLLHARICEFFGKPVPYADQVAQMRGSQDE